MLEPFWQKKPKVRDARGLSQLRQASKCMATLRQINCRIENWHRVRSLIHDSWSPMLNNSEMMRLAKIMHGRYGHLTEQVMKQRATENRSAGDVEAADLWTRVATFIRAMKATNQQRKLAKSFRPAFQVAPNPYLLVSPNLIIAGANDAYMAGTGARHSDLIGCELFDAFPDNPADPDADGVKNLKTSLTRVLNAGVPDVMERQRYDIPRRDGLFEERWWMVQNLPVFDDGRRLIFVLHHVQDVTASIKSRPCD